MTHSFPTRRSSDLQFRDLLSNDLGAIGGLLFDIGSGRYPAPPRDEEEQAFGSWPERLEQARADAQALNKALAKQRSEEHTSELKSLMRISYAVFCLKKQKTKKVYDITQLHA